MDQMASVPVKNDENLPAVWMGRLDFISMASLGAEVPGQHQSLATRTRKTQETSLKRGTDLPWQGQEGQ